MRIFAYKRCGGGFALVLWLASVASVASAATKEAESSLSRSFDRAMIIPITGEINDLTAGSIARRLDRVRAENIPLVIFKLDTPGGALGPMLKICHTIKQLRSDGIQTYAWVVRDAYSAGAIIAMATDGIVMAPNATMGDCQPIMADERGPKAIPTDLQPKLVSPVLEEMRDSAKRNGYSQVLIDAMVRPGTSVYWVENTETGERKFVDTAERDRLFGLSGNDEEAIKTQSADVTKGESKTAWRYVREHPELGTIRQPVVGANELLTMRDQRALAFGFSLATVANEAELRAFANIHGPIESAEETWMEAIVQWLASPPVRAILLMVISLGIYAEFHAPGVTLPGTAAVIALVLFLGAPYMAGFTVTWEIVVIVLGLVLIALEVFVIPGFGIAGIVGFVLLAFGILSSFVPPEPARPNWYDLPQLPITYRYLYQGLLASTAGLVGSLVGMILLSRYLPRAPIVGRVVGRNPTRAEVVVDDVVGDRLRVGDIGQTETLLRPAGKARFGSILVDVVSRGEYIESGQRVEVIEYVGNRVVVRKFG